MEKIIGGKIFGSTNNSNSIAEKWRTLPSTAQSRGLPSLAPVYRISIDRKRFTYLSYYPQEKKPTRSFPLNIERPPTVVQKIWFPDTKIPMEKSIIKRSLPLNNDLQLKRLKTSTVVEQKNKKFIEPASTYCATYVYDKWPEPKGFYPENSGFL